MQTKTLAIPRKVHQDLKDAADARGMKIQALAASLIEDGLFLLDRKREGKEVAR